jgi:hypothetical protein
MLPAVSVPIPRSASPEARAAAPPVEPPTIRYLAMGLYHTRCSYAETAGITASRADNDAPASSKSCTAGAV